MGEFGKALKEARKKVKKKLRDLSEDIGLSISYISDIEQGRKSPPESEVVRQIQIALLVEDDKLVELAENERKKQPTRIVQKIQQRSRLSDMFFRAENMTDEELDKWIDEMKKAKDG